VELEEILTPKQEDTKTKANEFGLLLPSQVAKMLNVTYGTLAAWRHNRRYPLVYVRIGRKIYYRRQDIEAFIAASVWTNDDPRPVRRRRKAAR
jgi:hypothetical protein